MTDLRFQCRRGGCRKESNGLFEGQQTCAASDQFIIELLRNRSYLVDQVLVHDGISPASDNLYSVTARLVPTIITPMQTVRTRTINDSNDRPELQSRQRMSERHPVDEWTRHFDESIV